MIEPTKAKDMYQTTRVLNIAGHEIPKGFEFDGMSAPWFLRSFLGGPYRPRSVEAVLLHDYLYSKKPTTRKNADWLFYRVLKSSGVRFSYVFYVGVRLFGWIHYR